MAAILNLLRLVSADLVLFRGLDIDRLEKAMREKIREFTNPIANQQAKEAGLAFARGLVDQILVQVRAQAELKGFTVSGTLLRDLSTTTVSSVALNCARLAPQSPTNGGQ